MAKVMACKCRFVAIGKPLDRVGCRVHRQWSYACERTDCLTYRPSRPKLGSTHWPRCECGAIAQDHN